MRPRMINGEDKTNNELEKFRLNFSRCSNRDMVTIPIDSALLVRSDTKSLSPDAVDVPQVDPYIILRRSPLIHLPRSKGERAGNLWATKSRARETNRKNYWTGLVESQLMPVNLRQRLSLIFTFLKAHRSRVQAVGRDISHWSITKYGFVYRGNASAHRKTN